MVQRFDQRPVPSNPRPRPGYALPPRVRLARVMRGFACVHACGVRRARDRGWPCAGRRMRCAAEAPGPETTCLRLGCRRVHSGHGSWRRCCCWASRSRWPRPPPRRPTATTGASCAIAIRRSGATRDAAARRPWTGTHSGTRRTRTWRASAAIATRAAHSTPLVWLPCVARRAIPRRTTRCAWASMSPPARPAQPRLPDPMPPARPATARTR